MESSAQILHDTLIGSLATVNEDGSPWVTPVHTVADDEAVYWFSKETVRHSQNIARDARVSLAVYSTDLSKGPKGVYINGTATRLDTETTARAKQLLETKIGFLPSNFIEATGYELRIGVPDNHKSTSNCWYFYS